MTKALENGAVFLNGNDDPQTEDDSPGGGDCQGHPVHALCSAHHAPNSQCMRLEGDVLLPPRILETVTSLHRWGDTSFILGMKVRATIASRKNPMCSLEHREGSWLAMHSIAATQERQRSLSIMIDSAD